MKTKLLLIALTVWLMLSSCSAEERVINDCNCVEEFYLRRPIVGSSGFTYEFVFSQPIEFDCLNEEFGFYYPVSNVNYNYAKVECE